MVSAFDNVAVTHNKYQVCVFDSRKSVCDNKARSALCKLIHCPLDKKLRSRIDRRCCFIKYEHRRILKHCPCDSEKLFLSCGYCHAFRKHCIKALRERMNELIQTAGFAHSFKGLVAYALHVVNKVFSHSALKKPCVLQNHAEHIVNSFTAQL